MKKLRRFQSSFFAVIICLLSCGQIVAEQKTDSLLNLLKMDEEDTNKVNHLINIARELQNNEPDSALYFTNQALQLSETLNWKKGKAESFYQLGYSSLIKGDYIQSILYSKKSLLLFEKQSENNNRARCFSLIGSSYRNQGHFPEALEHFFKSLKLGEELNDTSITSVALVNIGTVYLNTRDYSKALEYNFKALELCELLGDKSDMRKILNAIGATFSYQKNYPKAFEYYSKALKMAEELGNKRGVAIGYGNLGTIQDLEMNYPEAIDYYYKALKMAIEIGAKEYIAINLNNIGQIYIKAPNLPPPADENKKGYELAEKYLYQSLVLSDSLGQLNIIKSTYSQLSFLYETSTIPLHDTTGGKILSMVEMQKRSLYYYKRFISIKDSLFSDKNKTKELNLEMKYQLEKIELEQKIEQEKAEAEEKRVVMLQYMGVVLLIILLVAFIFIAARVQLSLKVIDYAGFIGVLLFFQFIEALLHPSISHYTQGLPALLMVVNIIIASSIKPIHHFAEKRLILFSHPISDKRKQDILQMQEEERLRKEEEYRRTEEDQAI